MRTLITQFPFFSLSCTNNLVALRMRGEGPVLPLLTSDGHDTRHRNASWTQRCCVIFEGKIHVPFSMRHTPGIKAQNTMANSCKRTPFLVLNFGAQCGHRCVWFETPAPHVSGRLGRVRSTLALNF